MSYFNIVVQSSECTVLSEYKPENKRSEAYQSEGDLEKEFIKLLGEMSYEYLSIHNENELIVTTVNSAADATDEDEWTEEQKREALEAMYAEENGGTDAVEETPAPASKKATKPVSDGVSAGKKDKPKVTQEEIRALAADVKTKTGSIDKVKALLNAYSAKNISALPADKWDEFAEKLKELL